MIEQLLFTLFCTVFFCLGLTLTSQEGYLLDFIAWPFRQAEKFVEQRIESIRAQKALKDFIIKNPDLAEQNDKTMQYYVPVFKDCEYYLSVIISKIGSPLITCITCMGSIWGVTWFFLLNGFSLYLLPYMIINCFAASFIQTFIWRLYERFL